MARTPYGDSRTKNWRDTQADINKLFQKYGIGDTQWSVSDEKKRAALSFAKKFKAATKWDPERRASVEIEPAKYVVVQIAIPIGPEGRERNSAFRALYWYLKSKLEAIEFRFQDGSELFSFEREFFGHTMIQDIHGRPATAFDAFKAGDVALAPPSNVIALTGGRS